MNSLMNVVVFHLDLAGKAPVVLNLLAGEMHCFGGQDFAASFGYTYPALGATALAAAG